MRFTETAVRGAFVIEPEPRSDARGFFARTWCRREFERMGLTAEIVQVNVSFNRLRGTLRGMHYQDAPHEEAKVVSCLRGALYDVVLDLRPSSPTYLRWAAVELDPHDRKMLYVPQGCAHGFQTLADDTEVQYFMSEFHAPGLARGVRYDDPAFALRWPLPPALLSEADQTWPNYRPLCENPHNREHRAADR